MFSKHKLKALLGVCVAAGALAAVSATPASAAFSLGECAGTTPIEGRGATFQTDAHMAANGWAELYNGAFCEGDTVTYTGVGSGAGRTAFRNREFAIAAFAGTDEAPSIGASGSTTNSTVYGIEEGGVAETDTRLLVIPVTSAAITTIVNTPANCEVVAKVGEGSRSNRAAISKQEIEEIYAGDAARDTWAELAAFSDSDTDCQVSIKRVARQDSSGTTSQFKLWLESVDDEFGDSTAWDTLAFGSENTNWPASVVKPASAGGPEVASKVEAEDASIGYVVLADAQPKFGEKEGAGDIYWLTLRTGKPSETTKKYEDPLAGSKSNCSKASYKTTAGGAVPTTTWGRSADWSTVVGFNAAEAYAICSLSYVLAWYDAADVSGGGGAVTQGRQRAVHDYLTWVTSEEGQLTPTYYSPLPTAIRETAETGAAMVCWSMAGEKETC